jgi:hypothetical protein
LGMVAKDLHPADAVVFDAANKELRALLACERALRRIRAKGGAWDVEARRRADIALAALRKVNK